MVKKMKIEEADLVSLSLAVGTIVTQEHINKIKKEANEYPVGSKCWKAFINYAESLDRQMRKVLK